MKQRLKRTGDDTQLNVRTICLSGLNQLKPTHACSDGKRDLGDGNGEFDRFIVADHTVWGLDTRDGGANFKG